MKKTLLLLAAILITTAINAQFLEGSPVLLKKSPDATLSLTAPGMKKAKAGINKVALENNQRVLGWYTGDELDSEGLGINTNATFKLAVYIPSSMLTKFTGGKVVKIRFGLAASATVNNVFLIPVTDNGIGDPVILQTLPTAAAEGWNEVEIETPAELVTDGSTDYLLGYQYVQKSGSYPLGYNPNVETQSYLYGNLGSGTGWYDMGTDYGFAIQAIVELDNIETYHVLLNEFYTDRKYAQSGIEIGYGLELENFGAEIPTDYSIAIALDGNVISTVQNPIELANAAKTYEGTLTLPENLETGKHSITASITNVMGETPANEYTQEDDIFVYQSSIPRQKFLVEQATSHSCTYCPLGEGVLKKLDEKCDMVWVAIHGNMSSIDPYYLDANDSWFSMMGLSGFPSGSLNRIPYDGELMTGLGYSAAYANAVAEYFAAYMAAFSAPSFASIDIQTSYNEDNKNLKVVVSGEALEDFKKIYGEDAVLTVYLTEDGLINRQLNQGTWISQYTHDHVLRQYITPYYGEQINWNGDSYENTYDVAIDASNWNINNMHVIAFLTRKIDLNNIDITKMDVNNAEIVNAYNAESSVTSITDINAGSTKYYTIDGREVKSANSGLIIVKQGDKVRKEIVR